MIEFLLDIYTRLFAKRIFVKLNKLIFLAGARGLGMLNFKNQYQSGEIPFLKKYLSKYDSKDYMILDVGANTGEFALGIFQFTKNIKITSFEPNPLAIFKLEKNIKYFSDRHTLIKKGLSNQNCNSKIFDFNDKKATLGFATIYKDVLEDIFKSKDISSYDIDLVTLDSQVDQLKNNVCLLKIDTEGHEKNVLSGASRFIREFQPKIILLEFNEMHIYSGTHFNDLKSILGKNYVPFRLLPGGNLLPISNLSPIYTELYAYQNIVFLNQKFSNN